MKMIVAEYRDGYGSLFKRYINPDKVRMISNTRDGTSIRFDNGEALTVITPATELVRQFEHCTDEVELDEKYLVPGTVVQVA